MVGLGRAAWPMTCAVLRLPALDFIDTIVQREKRVVGIQEVKVDSSFTAGLEGLDGLVLEAQCRRLRLRFVQAALKQHVRRIWLDPVIGLAAPQR